MGAPDRYDQWREGQEEAAQRAVSSSKKVIVCALPTGIGKSLVGWILAQAEGPTAFLTSTKALQDQYNRDFVEVGMADVRGMSNYTCLKLAEDWNTDSAPGCDVGPCLTGKKCEMKEDGCLYFDALRRAKMSPYLVTNYALWLTMVGKGGLGERSLLVMDEAHEADDQLTKHLRVELDESDIRKFLRRDLPKYETLEEWQHWAIKATSDLEERVLTRSDLRVRERREAMRLKKNCEAVSGAASEWVVEHAPGKVTIEPVWSRGYARKYYFDRAAKVVLMSATITQKDMELLGLAPDDYEWIEARSPFPVSRRPFIHLSRQPYTALSHRASEATYEEWVNRADQFIAKRQDRKGILDPVSYARGDYFYERSRFKDILLVHTPKTTAATVEAFKAAKAPSVLISPAVGTGHNFPYDLCEYYIIGKVPFPPTTGAVMQARKKDDPDYPFHLTMRDIVQKAGRGMRAEDDACETICIDDQIGWFMSKYGRFCPAYLLEAFRSVGFVPNPPPRIGAKNE